MQDMRARHLTGMIHSLGGSPLFQFLTVKLNLTNSRNNGHCGNYLQRTIGDDSREGRDWLRTFVVTMQIYPEIKRFVQETLGCSCPEEVFNQINYQKESDDISRRKINIGDRLLIYIITMDGKSNIKGVINSALEQGVEERDKKALNRFRLVLVASRPDELRSMAERVFDRSSYADEKTHLHIVNESDVESL